MKLHEVLTGGAVGIAIGAVLAQFFDLTPAIVVGIIFGISVAFAARGSRPSESDE